MIHSGGNKEDTGLKERRSTDDMSEEGISVVIYKGRIDCVTDGWILGRDTKRYSGRYKTTWFSTGLHA